MSAINRCFKQVTTGEDISFEQALELADTAEPKLLFEAADKLRQMIHGNHFDLCSIINARSGKCSENCRFCAQSSRYQTGVETYEMGSEAEVLRQGKENADFGVGRYSLVTAGHHVSEDDLDHFGVMYEKLGRETDLVFCASMGFLTREKAEKLVAAGVKRYHCNLETSRSYFPEVCTTHTWDQKVETLRIAVEAGMDICSGGIIGMGESFEQRLELAFELRELGVLSIPINILTPIPGTPMAGSETLTVVEILTCIAMFRFINPKAVIRLAGGRAQLEAEQYKCFLAGANGAIVGNYLTTAGNNIGEDLKMIKVIGFNPSAPKDLN